MNKIITIITEDRVVFTGKTYDEIVEKMNKDTWWNRTKYEYMAGVAGRCTIYDGSELKYGNAQEFIRELCRVGVIKTITIKGGNGHVVYSKQF